jgi:hypothetical protein
MGLSETSDPADDGAMTEHFMRWQCSENPKHRGWRDINEPRGTCDICLAVTRWEQEAQDADVREGAPSHLMPENRFPDSYPNGPPTQ